MTADAHQLTPAEIQEAITYLRHVEFTVPSGIGDEADAAWANWLDRHSLPLTEVTDQHLHDFLDHVRTIGPDGERRELKPSSIARTRAAVRGAFSAARKRRLIDWDPFDAVESPRQPDQFKVDAEMVMTPTQVADMAEACGAVHPPFKAFVLVQGMSGLRPGEAVALRSRDLVRSEGTITSIVVRGTQSTVAARYFTSDEDRRRPLKGRGPKATRTVPAWPVLADALADTGAGTGDPPNGPLFLSPGGRPIDTSNFYRDAWRPAREQVFAADDPLRSATLHDLRHAAITTWLNAGVALKTAQTWSGHRTLSVLLDTYLGVMKGDDAEGRSRVQALLDRRPPI